jgi:hypothetical protein
MVVIVDSESFSRFVAALPEPMEPALVRDDTVSTAFFAALRAGWPEDALISDAQTAVRRGGEVGVVVLRLRNLTANPPVDRSRVKGRPEWQRYSPTEAAYVPPGWVAERRALLSEIGASRLDPDAAEAAMVALIRSQNAREVAGADPFA